MKIICLHAHESNRIYMEKIFEQTSITVVHLVYSMSFPKNPAKKASLKNMVAREITPDFIGIIITCTGLFRNLFFKQNTRIPVLKIETLLIEALIEDPHKKTLFFLPTNSCFNQEKS